MSNNPMFRKTLALLLVGALLLSGCAASSGAQSGVNYLFTYSMTQPVKSDPMLFRDDYIMVQFSFDQSAVSFQLQNVSQANMSIVWEKVSLGVNKRIFPVRATSNFYSLGSSAPAPVLIPPLGYIRETVIPRENIYLEKDTWVEKDLFLSNDRNSARLKKAILSLAGSEVILTLPVKIGEITKEYSFTFTVSKIAPLPPHLLPPKKERPPAPKTPAMEASAGGSIVPVAIAAGVLGVAIYLLSQKKAPAADL